MVTHSAKIGWPKYQHPEINPADFISVTELPQWGGFRSNVARGRRSPAGPIEFLNPNERRGAEIQRPAVTLVFD